MTSRKRFTPKIFIFFPYCTTFFPNSFTTLSLYSLDFFLIILWFFFSTVFTFSSVLHLFILVKNEPFSSHNLMTLFPYFFLLLKRFDSVVFALCIFFLWKTLLLSAVICLREDHGAAGTEQDRPPSEAGGDPQPGQLLQGSYSRAEGQGVEGPVQLWSSGWDDTQPYLCVIIAALCLYLPRTQRLFQGGYNVKCV